MRDLSDYRMCARCVMDTTASEIAFYPDGSCCFCRSAEKRVKRMLEIVGTDIGAAILQETVDRIRASAKGKAYDSVLGLSGGLDSAYLAYQAVRLGLRPLMVHIDTGFNTPQAESNVRNLVNKLGTNLEVIRIDRDEMRDLQLAFYKASVPNCDIPQDHAFKAVLYRVAAHAGVKYILNGGNLATESILPRSWGYNASDARHLRAVHKAYGTRELQTYPTIGFWQQYVYYPRVLGIREVRLLNMINYRKTDALKMLTQKFGWQDYGYKHYESLQTRFFQGYYLPHKFGIDKRRAHLSSLIVSGQMSRSEALRELAVPPYPSQRLLEEDMEAMAMKLGVSLSEFLSILDRPPRRHEEFASNRNLYRFKDFVAAFVRVFASR